MRILRSRIQTMQPDERLKPERDLAQEFDVSYSTVRRVTNKLKEEGLLRKVRGKGTFVTSQEPDSEAPDGLIYADPWRVEGNMFFIRCLEGVLDEAERHGRHLHVFRCAEHQLDHDELNKLVALLESSGAAGVLLPWVNSALRNRITSVRPNLQIVSMTGRYPIEGVSSVALDFTALGRLGYRHLVDVGAKSVDVYATHTDTLLGVQHARMDSSDEIQLKSTRVTPGDAEVNVELVDSILERQPDALLADDDRWAAELMATLQEREPEAVENLHVASQANPAENILPSTASRLVVDSYQMGASAVNLLHRMITTESSLHLVTLAEPVLRPASGNSQR